MTANPRVMSVTGLSIPHSAAFGEAIANDPEQRRRSGHMVMFRTPFVAEYLPGTMDSAS